MTRRTAFKPKLICPSDALAELGSFKFRVDYRRETREGILVRHRGVAYGYLNRCVHMPKALDCERPEIFDDSGQSIRCSMHGITYEPDTGLCKSEICAGKSLTALKILEREGCIFLADKRGRLPD